MSKAVSLTKVDSLVQGLQKTDPKVYAALKEITSALDYIMVDSSAKTLSDSTVSDDDVPDVENLVVMVHKRYLELSWDPIEGYIYEVKLGSDWATANSLIKTAGSEVFLEADLYPAGTYTFLVKAKKGGLESVTATSVQLTLSGISTISNIDLVEFDNYFTLSWDVPESPFQIDYYEIKVDTTLLGNVSSNFFVYVSTTELSGTVYVTPVDIAGNRGTPASTQVDITASLDFHSLAKIVDSSFSGTKTNAFVDSVGLIAPVNTTEAFINTRITQTTEALAAVSWPVWAQPALTTGKYVRTFDFGKDYSNCFINFAYQVNQFHADQAVNVTKVVEYKTAAAANYTTLDLTSRLYVTAVRYVKVTMTFQGQSTLLPVCALQWLQVDLALHLAADSGEEVLTGVSSKSINFSLTYREAPKVVATVKSNSARFAAITAITKTNFTVKVYDSDGAAASGETVEWLARGGV